MAYYSDLKISQMSVNQMSKLISTGELTEKRLRQAYSYLRSKAMSREKRVGTERVVSEFGNTEREYFRKSKSLTTTSQLIREIADVNRYLRSPRSTITGLKQQRSKTINAANSFGFDVDESNYPDFAKFMQWFKSSEFALKFDSGSEEVAEVFNSEAAGPRDWRRLFEAYSRG